MHKIFSMLLIGCLSILFAEVFSGSSHRWITSSWGAIFTFILYTAHVLFLLSLALKFRRMHLSQLYLFGVILGLYESWITKVLWAGYIDSEGPGFGTLFGLSIPEFPILVFFWHPLMSFLLPILVFEALSGEVLQEHKYILRRISKKKVLIVIFLVCISTFIANGNKFNLLSSNMALIGTFLSILFLYRITKGKNLMTLKLGKAGFMLITIYLAILYVASFLFVLPERRPNALISYISTLIFYIIPAILIVKTNRTTMKMSKLEDNFYFAHDFIKFVILIILAVNIFCIMPILSFGILIITYLSFIVIGTAIFTIVIYKSLKQILLS